MLAGCSEDEAGVLLLCYRGQWQAFWTFLVSVRVELEPVLSGRTGRTKARLDGPHRAEIA